jgi:hypothetical protein
MLGARANTMGSRPKNWGVRDQQVVPANWWFLLAIVAARGDNVTLIPGLCGGGHAVGRECLAQMIQIHGPVLA